MPIKSDPCNEDFIQSGHAQKPNNFVQKDTARRDKIVFKAFKNFIIGIILLQLM